jgi:hypothetical protein
MHTATRPPGTRHVLWPAQSTHDLQMLGRLRTSEPRKPGVLFCFYSTVIKATGVPKAECL